jgi:4-diphosphocytidyl-2C-methyl-D-erythritol kinase
MAKPSPNPQDPDELIEWLDCETEAAERDLNMKSHLCTPQATEADTDDLAWPALGDEVQVRKPFMPLRSVDDSITTQLTGMGPTVTDEDATTTTDSELLALFREMVQANPSESKRTLSRFVAGLPALPWADPIREGVQREIDRVK